MNSVTAYQTYDIVYKTNENTGKVFKIDMSQEHKKAEVSKKQN